MMDYASFSVCERIGVRHPRPANTLPLIFQRLGPTLLVGAGRTHMRRVSRALRVGFSCKGSFAHTDISGLFGKSSFGKSCSGAGPPARQTARAMRRRP